jgi:hypothetical protein
MVGGAFLPTLRNVFSINGAIMPVKSLKAIAVKNQDGDSKAIVDDSGLKKPYCTLFDTNLRPYVFTLINQSISAYPRVGDIKSKDLFDPIFTMLLGIEPMDTIETMLAAQLVSVHNLCMEQISRAANSGRTDDIESFTNSAAKLSRTFIAQIEALERYRGRGGQNTAVGHVHVNNGGQAVIGNVEVGGKNGK